MRLLAMILVVSAAAVPSARAVEVKVLAQSRGEISDLFLYGGIGEVAWNWHDGDREGSTRRAPDGVETNGPPGLVDTYNASGTEFAAAAFSHDGTLMVVGAHQRIAIATHRHGVSDERFTDNAFRIFAWVERHQRLYASVARTPKGPFSPPKLLTGAGVRAMDVDDAKGKTVVWQDGRNRIRARLRTRRRFGPPVTIASPSEPVNELRATYDRYRGQAIVLWSTASGVRVATTGRDGRFGRSTRLSSGPASGIVTTFEGEAAWGARNGIHSAYLCPDGLRHEFHPVPGTPHLDAINNARQVAYTLDGAVYFEDERLGPGHDARLIYDEPIWIDGTRVMTGDPDTPGKPVGEFEDDPC